MVLNSFKYGSNYGFNNIYGFNKKAYKSYTMTLIMV